MTKVEDCVFCQIAQEPEKWVEHTRLTYIIEPLNPVVPGHLLVIPKEHCENFASSHLLFAAVAMHASHYAADFMGDWNFITSKGLDATQTVMHLHGHLVPRDALDGLHLPWTNQVKG